MAHSDFIDIGKAHREANFDLVRIFLDTVDFAADIARRLFHLH